MIRGNEKAAAAGLAAPIAAILVWLLGELGVKVPTEIATAIAAIVGALLVWLVPNRPKG